MFATIEIRPISNSVPSRVDLPGRFPRQVSGELRAGQVRQRDHAVADYVVQFDVLRVALAAGLCSRSTASALVRRLDDLQVVEFDVARHQQPERVEEQLTDLGLAGIGIGNIDKEPLGLQPTSIGERDSGIEPRAITGHTWHPHPSPPTPAPNSTP